MGSWKLEVLRMSIYMCFPVGIYWLFNQPQYFDGYLMKGRDKYYPKEELDMTELRKRRDEYETKKEEQLLQALQKKKNGREE